MKNNLKNLILIKGEEMTQTTTTKDLILKAKSERGFFKFATVAALLFTVIFYYMAFQILIPRLENSNQIIQNMFFVAYLGMFGSAFFAIQCIKSYFGYDQDIKRLENDKQAIPIKVKQDFYENIATLIIVICLTIISFNGFSIARYLNLDNLPDKGIILLIFMTPLMILPLAIIYFFNMTIKKYKKFSEIQTKII